jgi:hypothetical protein
VAQAQAASDPQLADAIWQAAAAAIGWGATAGHADAKALARGVDGSATKALTAARDAAIATPGRGVS